MELTADVMDLGGFRFGFDRRSKLECRGSRNSLGYDRTNLSWILTLLRELESWSLTTIHEKLIETDSKDILRARYMSSLTTNIAVPCVLFQHIASVVDNFRQREAGSC